MTDFERTHLNTVTPDALLMAAALIWSRTQFDHSAKTMVDRAEDLCREVQRRYDEQARIDAVEGSLMIAAAEEDLLIAADAARAMAAWKIVGHHRLAVLLMPGGQWVVKPEGDNERRVQQAGTPCRVVLEWARLHAPEDLLASGLDPRSDTFDPLPPADLAAMAEAQTKRGGA